MHRNIFLPLSYGWLILMWCVGGLYAQATSTVELVAYEKGAQTVKDLTPADIDLRMDGRAVAIESLRLAVKPPPTMILLIDTSYTAMNNRPLFKDIVTAFIDAKPRGLEMAIATINQAQQFLSPYQKSTDELVSTLQKVKFGGEPPLSQCMFEALRQFDPGQINPSRNSRRVMVLLSDGTDFSSREIRDSARAKLKELGYTVYTINHVQALKAIFDAKFLDRELVRLAEETGGRSFRLANFGDITHVAREIYDRETNTYQASIRTEGKLLPSDRGRFKVKSRRKDVVVEVVTVH